MRKRKSSFSPTNKIQQKQNAGSNSKYQTKSLSLDKTEASLLLIA